MLFSRVPKVPDPLRRRHRATQEWFPDTALKDNGLRVGVGGGKGVLSVFVLPDLDAIPPASRVRCYVVAR